MTIEVVAPESVGLSSQRLDRIQHVMSRYIDNRCFRGLTTMIWRNGSVAHLGKFGQKDDHSAIEFDTIFRIYSMTKPITSVAIMMLYEEGHFQLSDPVSKFIPDFSNMKVITDLASGSHETVPAKGEMTIHDLLRHTSGLTYDFNGNVVSEMYKEADLYNSESLLEMAQKLASFPLVHHPGKIWHYSFSTDVLGCLVELIAGQPFDQFLQHRIFSPLGMYDTSFDVDKKKIDRYASLYRATKEGKYEKASDSIIARLDASGHKRTICSGGGGLLSTTADYLRFCQMMLNGGFLDNKQLLSRTTVELMTCNHLVADQHPFGMKGVGFGLGFSVVTNLAESAISGSEGLFRWGGAASTTFWIDPKEKLITILMTQLLNNPHPLLSQFRVLTYQSIVD